MIDKKVTTVQSVDRALQIIELLKENPKGLGVTELSYRLDVSKSTVHRLLMSLLQKNFVCQDIENQRYQLGLKFLEIGESVLENMDIRDIARPMMTELAKSTEEVVHLVVMENNEIVYIDKIEGYAKIRMHSKIGLRSPVYCTGVGKAILAFIPESDVSEILDSVNLVSFTKNTIIEKEKLKSHLKDIRKRGYSIDNEEHEEGIKCAAAPIINHKGEVVAALSVTGPIMRVTDEKLTIMGKEVVQVANKISNMLGAKK